MTEPGRQSWSLAASWIAAAAIAWILGFGILGNLGVPLLLGLSFGLILGLAQFPIVRRFADPNAWLRASAFGWGLGFVLATGIAYLWPGLGLKARQLLFLLLWGVFGAGLTGAIGVLVPTGRPDRGTTLLAIAAMGAVAGLASQYILALGLDNAIMADSMWNIWAVAAYAASGAAYGAITTPYVLYLSRASYASSMADPEGPANP